MRRSIELADFLIAIIALVGLAEFMGCSANRGRCDTYYLDVDTRSGRTVEVQSCSYLRCRDFVTGRWVRCP